MGIVAQSHKVIHNLIDAIEQAAGEEGPDFRGIKYGEKYETDHVKPGDLDAVLDPDVHLVAEQPGSTRARSWTASSTRWWWTRPVSSALRTHLRAGLLPTDSFSSETRFSLRRSRRVSILTAPE